jgi:hypothetical protein
MSNARDKALILETRIHDTIAISIEEINIEDEDIEGVKEYFDSLTLSEMIDDVFNLW